MDEALAWKRGRQVVPNLLWVFRPLTTTLSSWRVSSDWPGHCPSPPGFQLVPSLLCQSQQEALSDASPSLRMAAFLKWPLSPTFVNRFHTDWAGNPRHPTSNVISHVVHPLSRQSWTSCWYLPFFLSAASSQPSSHGTVNSTRMIFFPSGDHIMMSGLRVVDSTVSGSGVSSRGQPPFPIPWLTARDSVWLGWGQQVFGPLSQRRWCSAVVLLWLVVSSPFPAPGCLLALPTPCHGATCISPVLMQSCTLTECAPLFLSRHTTCTVGPPSSPTCANLLGLVRCHTLLGVERIYGRAPAATVHSMWLFSWGGSTSSRHLELRARWLLLFSLLPQGFGLHPGSWFSSP